MSQNFKSNVIIVRTPEGVSFPLYLAGPATRCCAWFIDLLVILVAQNVISYFVRFAGLISPGIAAAFAIILYFAISISYGIFFEWYWDGRTIGKRVLQIRVMDAQGLRLQFAQVVIRNLLRVIDSLPAFYLAGGLFGLVSERYQRLGDLAAQTIVVRQIQSGEPDLSKILPDKYNSFREHPLVVARLRSRISPDQSALVLRVLLRRDSLDADARNDIYEQLVSELKKVAEFPQEAVDGISDERYLRNLVDVLYRS